MSRRRLEGHFYFTIVIKALAFTVVMNENDSTVQDIKDRIHDTRGTRPDQQLLIYEGKELEDGMYGLT